MITRPKFSVIAVDYDQHVPRDGMRAGLQSLADQTFKDFELVIVHDGPKSTPYEDEVDFKALGLSPVILNTPERMNNWGHSGRDLGMRHATGDYFVQFNIDNRFFPGAFKFISDGIDETTTGEEIFIFTIRHFKHTGGRPFYGVPPVHCAIDAMQLVAHRDIWEDMDYWYKTEPTSDGMIYEEMCHRFPYKHLGYDSILGDNY